eukprot:405784-Pyramimonas_sp.AAC.1
MSSGIPDTTSVLVYRQYIHTWICMKMNMYVWCDLEAVHAASDSDTDQYSYSSDSESGSDEEGT